MISSAALFDELEKIALSKGLRGALATEADKRLNRFLLGRHVFSNKDTDLLARLERQKNKFQSAAIK